MNGPTFIPALLDHYTELVTTILYLGRSPESAPDIDSLSALLTQLLERSKRQAKTNGIGDKRWLEGLYPVVAWIDEQLLNLNWPGKQQWAARSLQRTLFQTTLAGRDFFVRLEKLAADDRSLREVYDLCLALGFRGQFFHPDDQERLGEMTDKNLQTMGFELPLQLPQPLFAGNDSKIVFDGIEGLKGQTGYSPANPFIQALLWLLPLVLLLGLYFVLRGNLPTPG